MAFGYYRLDSCHYRVAQRFESQPVDGSHPQRHFKNEDAWIFVRFLVWFVRWGFSILNLTRATPVLCRDLRDNQLTGGTVVVHGRNLRNGSSRV